MKVLKFNKSSNLISSFQSVASTINNYHNLIVQLDSLISYNNIIGAVLVNYDKHVFIRNNFNISFNKDDFEKFKLKLNAKNITYNDNKF